MAVWFEGSGEIGCSIKDVKLALDDPGALHLGIVAQMPGLTDVELVEQGAGFVTIRTNEGLMKRTNISTVVEPDRVVIEFDEEYQAGRMVTATSHFQETFTTTDSGVTHRTVMSGVEAPGVLGFFYRKLGSTSIGNAFLKANKAYFEQS